MKLIGDLLVIVAVSLILEATVHLPARRREQRRQVRHAYLMGITAANAVHNATCPAAIAMHQ